MISGQTYEPRQTAGVLPNTSAVSLIAATIFLFRAVFVSGISSAFARERTRANERACPGAKVFRTEIAAHHFLDVLVDVTSRYLHRLSVAIYILENVEARQFHRGANHARDLFIP